MRELTKIFDLFQDSEFKGVKSVSIYHDTIEHQAINRKGLSC